MMWTTSRIRKQFLDYFQQQGHTIVDSSPLIPRNDPTLLFTTAGMVQFKNMFTGIEKRSYSRASTSQKCVRAGGKHNDLENVGYTSRHHTFFEMLGNFSFGDYFKDAAIEMAWNLITKEFGIDKNRLLVTVYADDDEAAGYWRKIAGLSDDRILRISSSDNFWSMGDTGPCGPCSEIFYDHGDHLAGGPPGTPDEDGERFVEIWNLVFMQYEQLVNQRINLPKPSIDTGMGLERIAAVLQGVHDNYDIDLFKALIRASVDLTGIKAEGKNTASHRVIADHLRSTSFLIAEGITPSNEGRGYVLRRIMRRAMRHAYLLGCKEPLMHQLVPTLLAEMGEAYPELTHAQTVIQDTLRVEEERFRQTLGRGLKLLEEETISLNPQESLSGDVAFKLYDTYGFPLDLTQDILRTDGRQVDLKSFDAAMAKQKAVARASWVGSGEQQNDSMWFQVLERTGASEFLGYDTVEAQGLVQTLIINGQEVTESEEGQEVLLILNQTPFYGESGGQMGDTGLMISDEGLAIEIQNTTKKLGNLHVHQGLIKKGKVQLGQTLTLKVDIERRNLLRANHSATHLLHAVLRQHLGEQVIQKGSLVAPDRLRFDFSFPLALTREQLSFIENDVNSLIRQNNKATTQVMAPEEAIKAGAMALFGEKYSEEVRVVSMGPEGANHKPYSVELCGGTHVHRTGDIGYFKIVSEAGIAAGIRRIEALTGPAAEIHMAQREQLVLDTAGLLKSRPEDILLRLTTLQDEKRKLERDVKDLQKKLMTGSSTDAATQTIAGVKFLSRALENVSANDLKPLVDQLKNQIGSGVVIVGSNQEGKGSIVVGVTADLISTHNAVDLVRLAAEALGGKGGGGRPDLAQAGGPNGDKLEAAFMAVQQSLSKN
ncbi:MAG: alanine--tRNA ligase [Candidatus Paracaedimonas acanthamoebae]|uniref:Alanine--tRNA ligase n=1 Tax=Candidatus Paracaedimonas acanthamoebae TaxID=244581 RepID=A0A8J7PJA9_9PROT|nr:alanine--tRNA ligase [Candidatus Paracaedimonas acanthamoebae]